MRHHTFDAVAAREPHDAAAEANNPSKGETDGYKERERALCGEGCLRDRRGEWLDVEEPISGNMLTFILI